MLLAICNGTIVLGNDLLTLSNLEGIVSIRTGGTAGRIGTAAAVTVPGLVLSADLFEVEFNTGTAAVTADFAGQLLGVPGGPYMRVRIDELTLIVGTEDDPFLTLHGNVLVLKNPTSLTFQASTVRATIGDINGVHLALRNGSGDLTITTAGITGTLSGIVELKGVPGVTLLASLSVTFANTGAQPTLSVTGAADDLGRPTRRPRRRG